MIVHIAERPVWEHAQRTGEYRAASLEIEGYIHCSQPKQILGVANRFYQGKTNLFILWIDPGRLQAPLSYEMNEGEIYPHIYGPVNLDSVVRVTELKPDRDGEFRT